MNLTVCTITRRSPSLLGFLVRCFERQTYPARYLVILDDSGRLAPASGDRWRLYGFDKPLPTLGSRRNACARLVPGDTQGLAVWDEEHVYLPWALEATAAALQHAEWSRPGVYCLREPGTGRLLKVRSHAEGNNDNASPCSWGIQYDAFWAVGGFDEHRDRHDYVTLAMKLLARDTPEIDPVAMGYRPWCVENPYGPDTNSEGDEGPWGVPIQVGPPPVTLSESSLPVVAPRPWQHDWYEEIRT